MRTQPCILWLVGTIVALAGAAVAQTLPFGISLPPSLNFATSPSPVGSGARAVGKGNAFIAIADDATAASHNPAGLVQLERPEVSIVGSYFLRFESQDVTRADTVVAGQTLHGVDLNYLSAVYPFELLRRTVVVSLNVQRLFDLQGATDVTSLLTTPDVDGTQSVRSRQTGGLYTISPAVAVQITPTFSAGITFNIWPRLFDNGWDQNVTVQDTGFVVKGNSIVPFTASGRIKEEYAFRGFNVTAGFLWTINPTFSLGGVLRSPFTAKVKYTHTSMLTVAFQDGSTPVSTENSFHETLDMDMPLSYGLGLAARPSDRLTLSLDVSRIHWSDFRLEPSQRRDTLLVENGAPAGKGRAVLNGQSDDTTSVRLGMEYLWIRPQFLTSLIAASPSADSRDSGSQLRVVIPIRAGFFYDPEPGNRGTDPFFGFSLGTGVAINRFLFDIAYTFRAGTVHSEATDTSVTQHNILASVIYHF